ncbi:hypothetical protein HU830_06330 [Lactobacillus sp. DCY120]|uniref:Uncharacterized protein n=1 Tax=Bombilactobacillus apium TaxID=2675299 RepID=A0A850R468_9LACO|nr:hypothetical protein [Bombilactobacillus apium]NVY96771.1 hypothetical protein [Bombilactobacillus apium]
MECEIKEYSDLNEYFTSFFKNNNNISEIPFFVDGRPDLNKKIYDLSRNNIKIQDIFKSDYGIIISNDVLPYEKSSLFCNKWITVKKLLNLNFTSKTVVVIGLYKDFTQKKVLAMINYCYSHNTEVYFLVGRDLSSLTWLIGKQFLKDYFSWNKEGMFSLLNLSGFSNNEREFFDNKDLASKNVRKILEGNEWKQLVFHGHGKEDHLNLDDYTLTGMNDSVDAQIPFAPSIGHEGQAFFKDESKAVLIDKIKVKQLFFLSCNNFPFYDSRLYDSKFNIVLDAIDGWAESIIASIAVQSADSPELSMIIKHSDDYNIGFELNKCLSDIQAMISIITIGLPKVNVEITNSINNNHRLTSITCNILSRISNYTSSMMLNDDHPIKRMAKKIFSDYAPLTKRGRNGTTLKDMVKFENELINRVNPFSKRMAQIMFLNQNDNLHDFDGFNTYRSTIDPKSIYEEKCFSCDGLATHCLYVPEISSFFKIRASYCYRCGDKSAAMINMPTIKFTCDEYNKKDLTIHYKIEFISEQKGDVYFGIQLPSYIEQSVVTKLQIQRLKFKESNIVKVVEGDIKFKENTILQSYYLKLFAVQNGGIAVDRCFFNLI